MWLSVNLHIRCLNKLLNEFHIFAQPLFTLKWLWDTYKGRSVSKVPEFLKFFLLKQKLQICFSWKVTTKVNFPRNRHFDWYILAQLTGISKITFFHSVYPSWCNHFVTHSWTSLVKKKKKKKTYQTFFKKTENMKLNWSRVWTVQRLLHRVPFKRLQFAIGDRCMRLSIVVVECRL